MVTRGLVVFACVIAMGDAAYAQLQLRNSSNDTIVMRYRPSADRFGSFSEVSIGSRETVMVALNGQDPFDVSFRPERNNGVQFEATVGRPLPLKKLANAGRVYDVRAAVAQVPGGGARVMTATVSAGGMSEDAIIKEAVVPAITKAVLAAPWMTTYDAVDGSRVNALVNFERRTFGQQGRFSELLVVSDDKAQEIRISGRWHFGDFNGDVAFVVDMNNNKAITGKYRLDGQRNGTWSWSGGR